jgi:hypothetical protein
VSLLLLGGALTALYGAEVVVGAGVTVASTAGTFVAAAPTSCRVRRVVWSELSARR